MTGQDESCKLVTCQYDSSMSWLTVKLFLYINHNFRFMALAHKIHYGEQLLQASRHERSEGVLCKFKPAGKEYLKYTVSGVNILFMNLTMLVVITIFNAGVVQPHFQMHSSHPWLISLRAWHQLSHFATLSGWQSHQSFCLPS